jgi:hypothetical protein
MDGTGNHHIKQISQFHKDKYSMFFCFSFWEARRTYNTSTKVKKVNGKLPWRWERKEKRDGGRRTRNSSRGGEYDPNVLYVMQKCDETPYYVQLYLPTFKLYCWGGRMPGTASSWRWGHRRGRWRVLTHSGSSKGNSNTEFPAEPAHSQAG